VTLEQDLARRDLTINAMAMDDDGSLIDPFQGARDLQARVLRHVSPAFAEDPVRLLRTARFAARFDTFEVHPDTRQLMRQLVQGGEVDALVAERVWQELSKGLMEGHPGRMLQVLQDCGALQKLLPEVEPGERLLKVLEQCAKIQAPLAVRWACLMLDVSHENPSAQLTQQLADRLKVSTECRALADVVTREHGHIHQSDGLGAEATLHLLERCDALRRPDRFNQVLQACECDARGRLGLQDPAYAPAHRLAHALQQVLTVDTEPVVSQAQTQGLDGPALGQAVRQARILALEAPSV
jgi:tRNA nucleotidyltransferase (CCA-adding enzyme)